MASHEARRPERRSHVGEEEPSTTNRRCPNEYEERSDAAVYAITDLGVVAATILIAVRGRAWPDLVVGLAIVLVAARGGIEILLDARRDGRSV